MATPVIVSSKNLVKLSHAAFVDVLKTQAKSKERPLKTFQDEHKLGLEALNNTIVKASSSSSSSSSDQLLQTLQIGDSLLERLKSLPPAVSSQAPETKSSTKGPSSSSLEAIQIGSSGIEPLKDQQGAVRIATIPHSFNLGVGGDKIENVLYRLSLGTYNLLLPQSPQLKLVIVQVGTNNLRPMRSLTPEELSTYGLLIKALPRIAPKAQILCCGLFTRQDVPDWVVAQSNVGLSGVVDWLNGKGGEEDAVKGWMGRVRFVPAPKLLQHDGHFFDHVHLNREGYQAWDSVLWLLLRSVWFYKSITHIHTDGRKLPAGCRLLIPYAA